MGKPSLTKIAQNSNSSICSTTMSARKKGKNRKQKNKQKQLTVSLQKLFNNLRSELVPSEEANESAGNVTVINLDDTCVDSPVNKKRKLDIQSEEVKQNTSCIVIKDEECDTPKKLPKINCSTPKSSIKSPGECNISNVFDLTKEVNMNSFLTVDLTTETLDRTQTDLDVTVVKKDLNQNKVIDVEKYESQDCSIVSVSANSISDNDVTVIRKDARNSKIQKYAKGIANLNSDEKGRLLELITQNIFSGCNVSSSSSSLIRNKAKESQATETEEDAYIKEVILGQSQSRNSIGSNIYNPEKELRKKTQLRMVVIDGSNVAMEHGKGKYFSVKGLKICIDYFVKRGHIVKAFVPRFRCKYGKSTEPRVLDNLERQGLVVYTPSREVQGRMITSYDDRYIIQCAAEFDGVIVSGDNYRDLLQENPRWRFVIENRLLPFTWVEDMIMFPKDPMGRRGPTLEKMLKRT